MGWTLRFVNRRVPRLSFAYTIYIAASAESVCNALHDGEFTSLDLADDDVADRWSGSPPDRKAGGADHHSSVTFDVETLGSWVRLTVTHKGMEAGSEMERQIRQLWPRALLSLKLRLETRRPMHAVPAT